MVEVFLCGPETKGKCQVSKLKTHQAELGILCWAQAGQSEGCIKAAQRTLGQIGPPRASFIEASHCILSWGEKTQGRKAHCSIGDSAQGAEIKETEQQDWKCVHVCMLVRGCRCVHVWIKESETLASQNEQSLKESCVP